ncbi:MAG: hypothetical protein AAF098_16085 [Pseudomonadota bacterium]
MKIYDELLSVGNISLILSSYLKASLVTWGRAIQRLQMALPVVVDEILSKGRGLHVPLLIGELADFAVRQGP